MRVTLRITELEEMLEAAKREYAGKEVEMNPIVEIEVMKQAEVHGASDRVMAGLQYGWSECGNKTIYAH